MLNINHIYNINYIYDITNLFSYIIYIMTNINKTAKQMKAYFDLLGDGTQQGGKRKRRKKSRKKRKKTRKRKMRGKRRKTKKRKQNVNIWKKNVTEIRINYGLQKKK